MQNPEKTFLDQVVDKLHVRYGTQITGLTILLPNKRAHRVLQQHLAQQMKKPIWSPRILTLANLAEQLSQSSIVSPFNLVFALYKSFQTISQNQESFTQFYQWGEILLQDFDIIDKYLIDADQLFNNISDQKFLAFHNNYLTEAQKNAIRSFWKTFEERISKHQASFLQFWQLLKAVYTQFTTKLLSQNIGYEGLIYKKAYQALKTNQVTELPTHIAMIGFHALHPAEEQILILLQQKISTDFYWDVDAYYMEDQRQEAGHYLRTYLAKQPFQASFPSPLPKQICTYAKDIHFFAVASNIGQVQVIGHELQALIERQGQDFCAKDTAIIVADESLFLPMLDALPEHVQKINASLGYPLRNTAIYQLFDQALTLQQAISQPGSTTDYLPTDLVCKILEHPYIRQVTDLDYRANKVLAKQFAQVYIKQTDLAARHPLLQTILQPIQSSKDLVIYLQKILLQLDNYLTQGRKILRPTEKKALAQLYQQLNKIQQTEFHNTKSSLQDFIQFFKQVITPIEISLNEDNAEGIYMLRMWETNNLDFKQVFILGMNEGCFPTASAPSSFIPYNLRKGYGLPTADTFQASLDAYYFYRLLQRTQHIYITYSTQAVAGKNQEMSRYLWQLIYESTLPIKHHTIDRPIQLHTVKPIVIKKSRQVQEELEKFIVKSGKATYYLTPSALNTYLTCSLKFYFQYLAKIRPKVTFLEKNEAVFFGTLFHQAISALYRPLLYKANNPIIQQQAIEDLRKQVPVIVQTTFAQALYHEPQDLHNSIQDSHTILKAVIGKLMNKILDIDQAYAPFKLLGVEAAMQKNLSLNFRLNHHQVVGLQGIIDRIDTKGDVVRVVDYKTGPDERQLESIHALFDRHQRKRNTTAFQVLFYAWLYKKIKANPETLIVPTLYHTRTVFETTFNPHLYIKTSTNALTPIVDISPYEASFEASLKEVLHELFDAEIPFQQTDALQHCSYCPYQGICQR
jgi:CRISPR/Cas system-associated exonuclease Cas4 (RecB family)